MSSENQIIIKNVKLDAIKKALKEWLELRIDEDNSNLVFKLYENGANRLVIIADPRLNEIDFFYLINFLSNSADNDRKGTIDGYTTGKSIEPFKEKKLQTYVSEDDLDISVSVITEENIFYTVEFDGNIIRNDEVKKYKDPEKVYLEIPEIIEFNKIASQKLNKTKENITIRFIIISIIFSVLLYLSFKIQAYDFKSFYNFFNSIGIALGIWFYIDFKMLRLKRFYFLSLVIGISILLLSLSFSKGNPDYLINPGAYFPLVLLLTQRILRKLFIFFIKKEPEVNRFGELPDRIYTATLFLVSFFFLYLVIAIMK